MAKSRIKSKAKKKDLTINLVADTAILYQVVVSIIGGLSESYPTLCHKILSDADNLVDDIVFDMENMNPPNDDGIAAIRQSLEKFRKMVS